MLGLVAGRILGGAILGFAIGCMVALIEAAFRSAWLEIKYGPRETGTANLGTEPVSIGSDMKLCTVYAAKAALQAFRYSLRQGQIICEDVVEGKSSTVQPGDRRIIGSIEVTVRTAAQTTAARTAHATDLAVAVPSTLPTTADRSAPVSSGATRDKPAPSVRSSKGESSGDGCPGCGRKAPGAPGKRYCMICERIF